MLEAWSTLSELPSPLGKQKLVGPEHVVPGGLAEPPRLGRDPPEVASSCERVGRRRG